jgi:hypothetical protein
MRGASPAHRRAPDQERELAAKVGGRVVARSGAGVFEKADVRRVGVLRLEAKVTSSRSFSVTREMLRKLEDAAAGAGELPALIVEFLGADGLPAGSVAIVPGWAVESFAPGANFSPQPLTRLHRDD